MKPSHRVPTVAAMAAAIGGVFTCPASAENVAGRTFLAVYYPPASPLEIATQAVAPILGTLLLLFGVCTLWAEWLAPRTSLLLALLGMVIALGPMIAAEYFGW